MCFLRRVLVLATRQCSVQKSRWTQCSSSWASSPPSAPSLKVPRGKHPDGGRDATVGQPAPRSLEITTLLAIGRPPPLRAWSRENALCLRAWRGPSLGQGSGHPVSFHAVLAATNKCLAQSNKTHIAAL